MKSTDDLREYALKSTNQDSYARCNVPRSAEEAEADLDGFARAVRLLRMEYRIPELVLGASVPVAGGETNRAAAIIMGNRAHAAPQLAASLLRHAERVAQVLLEESRPKSEATVDWAAAWTAVCALRAALEVAGDPDVTATVRRLIEEAKDLRAAQDAGAGLVAALRSAGLWRGRLRDAAAAMVRALGGSLPDEE